METGAPDWIDMIRQVGKTIDGKIVVAGLGKFYFESGLPLSVMFDSCQRMNLQPSFIHLISELKENGMKSERIVHLLNEHVFESYGKKYRDEVMKRVISGNWLSVES